MKFGIVVFPGTWSDRDCYYSISNILGQKAAYIWHKDTDLSGFDCIVLPGGFSYGDYLRTGAIARFSPVMEAVADYSQKEGRLLASVTASRFYVKLICCPACCARTTTCSTAASGPI